MIKTLAIFGTSNIGKSTLASKLTEFIEGRVLLAHLATPIKLEVAHRLYSGQMSLPEDYSFYPTRKNLTGKTWLAGNGDSYLVSPVEIMQILEDRIPGLDPQVKNSLRPLLIAYGNEMKEKYGPHHFVDSLISAYRLLEEVADDYTVIIDDGRYYPEYERLSLIENCKTVCFTTTDGDPVIEPSLKEGLLANHIDLDSAFDIYLPMRWWELEDSDYYLVLISRILDTVQ